jgi:hypothetical protein
MKPLMRGQRGSCHPDRPLSLPWFVSEPSGSRFTLGTYSPTGVEFRLAGTAAGVKRTHKAERQCNRGTSIQVPGENVGSPPPSRRAARPPPPAGTQDTRPAEPARCRPAPARRGVRPPPRACRGIAQRFMSMSAAITPWTIKPGGASVRESKWAGPDSCGTST